MQIFRIRLSDKTSCLHSWRVVPTALISDKSRGSKKERFILAIKQKQESIGLKPLWFVLKAGVTAVILYFLFTQDWGKQALHELGSIESVWAIVAFLVLCLQALLAAIRWRWIVRWLTGANVKTSDAFGWNGVAVLIGQVLPSTVGGDAFRIGALAAVVGVNASFRTVLIDRAIGMVALALIVVPTGLILAIEADFAFVSLVPLAVASAGVSFAVLLMLFSRLSLGHFLARPLRVVGKDLFAVLQERRFIRTTAIALSIHFLSIMVFLLMAGGLHLGAEQCWLIVIIVPPALLISAFPISLGGWGIREGVIVMGFVLLGKDPGIPLLLSILFGALTVGAALVGTLVWVIHRPTVSHSPDRSPSVPMV